LKTKEGEAAFKQSLEEAAKDMTDLEKEAYLWAVSDLNLAKLAERYPNSSPRDIVRGEVRLVLAETPAKISALQERRKKFDQIGSELDKLTASNVEFKLERGVFDELEPRVLATVTNGSSLDVSRLEWRAELWIEGKSEPVATAELWDDYASRKEKKATNEPQGLMRGQSYQREFRTGRVYRSSEPYGSIRVGSDWDDSWSTLEIRRATKHTVKLVVIRESVRDLGDRPYMDGAPNKQIEQLQRVLERARKYNTL
jgi:hypothetical protein